MTDIGWLAENVPKGNDKEGDGNANLTIYSQYVWG